MGISRRPEMGSSRSYYRCTSIGNVALAVAALVLLRCRTCARLAAQTVLLKMQLCGYTSAFFRLMYQEEPVVHVSQKELLLQ